MAWELSEDEVQTEIAVHSRVAGCPAVVGWHPWFRRDLGTGRPVEWSLAAVEQEAHDLQGVGTHPGPVDGPVIGGCVVDADTLAGAASEQAVQKFRAQSGLLGPGGTMVTQQISDLNAQLMLVRTARTEAETRLARVRQAMQSAGGGDALATASSQQLADQEAALKRPARPA